MNSDNNELSIYDILKQENLLADDGSIIFDEDSPFNKLGFEKLGYTAEFICSVIVNAFSNYSYDKYLFDLKMVKNTCSSEADKEKQEYRLLLKAFEQYSKKNDISFEERNVCEMFTDDSNFLVKLLNEK